MILASDGITKSFQGVEALVDVSLGVEAGEILGIIGPNGSGKTTLFNILSGQVRPDRGRVTLAGQPVTALPPHRIAALGLARTFQNLRLFPGLSVLENVMAGGHLRAPAGFFTQMLRPGWAGRREAEARDEARALLEDVGLGGYAEARPTEISYGQTKRLELARALNTRPRAILLDEPTAGMNDAQASDIIDLLADIRRRRGLALVIVEHNVPVLNRIAERIAVLDAGRLLTIGTPQAVVRDPRVIAAYLGADAAQTGADAAPLATEAP